MPNNKKCFCHFFDPNHNICVECQHCATSSGYFPDAIVSLPQCFQKMYQHAPYFLTREALSELAGGAISPKTLANRDALGIGPKKRQLFNRKVVYPREEGILWLSKFYKNLGDDGQP